MTESVGYIYIRSHPAYDAHDACKMGKTESIPERDSQYATGEIQRGKFGPIFEIPIKNMGIVENILKCKFNKLNIRIDAGTEFFNKKIIMLIEPYMIKLGIQYRRLSEQEIDKLNRKYRILKLFIMLVRLLIMKMTNQEITPYVQSQKQSLLDSINEKLNCFSPVPREDQIVIIETSVAYLSEHNKGLLQLFSKKVYFFQIKI